MYREFIAGIIGGTGSNKNILKQTLGSVHTNTIKTPYALYDEGHNLINDGAVECTTGFLKGRRIIFISRHGSNGSKLSHEVNPLANIYCLAKQNVTNLFSISASGAVDKSLKLGDMVIVNQFFIRGPKPITFFGRGVKVNVSLHNPTCNNQDLLLHTVGKELGMRTILNGTYLQMVGPQFSFGKESELYKQWGMTVISMDAGNEAKLARECEMCFSTIAYVTDMDDGSSESSNDSVSASMVEDKAIKYADDALRLVLKTIPQMPIEKNCGCAHALDNAITTNLQDLPPTRLNQLRPILRRFIKI